MCRNSPKYPKIPRALQHIDLKNYRKTVELARQYFDSSNEFQHYKMLDEMYLLEDQICEYINGEDLTEVHEYFERIYVYCFDDGKGDYYPIPEKYIRQYQRGISC